MMPSGLSPVIAARKILQDKKEMDSKEFYFAIRKSAECGLPAAKGAVESLIQGGQIEVSKDPNDGRHYLVKWKG